MKNKDSCRFFSRKESKLFNFENNDITLNILCVPAIYVKIETIFYIDYFMYLLNIHFPA